MAGWVREGTSPQTLDAMRTLGTAESYPPPPATRKKRERSV